MNTTMRLSILASAALMSLSLSGSVQAQQADMTFFVTSVGSGKGADLGGLAGADAHCQRSRSGRRRRQDLARLSEHQRRRAGRAVNARDRIGNGPWQNPRAT